jgi:hypothetical protein
MGPGKTLEGLRGRVWKTPPNVGFQEREIEWALELLVPSLPSQDFPGKCLIGF